MEPKRILLVDDEADIREVADVSLGLVGGYHVATAASGMEAVEKAVAERPDAILLDVMMPGIDGTSTLQRLRADPATSDIPVILLTAKVQAADRRRFHQLGVAGVLAKPFDPMALAGQVSRTLGWDG